MKKSLGTERKGRLIFRIGQPTGGDVALSLTFGLIALVVLVLSLMSDEGSLLSGLLVSIANALVALGLARSAAGGVIMSKDELLIRNLFRSHRFSWPERPHFSLGELQKTGTKPNVIVSTESGRSVVVRSAVPWYRATPIESAEIVLDLNRAARRIGENPK